MYRPGENIYDGIPWLAAAIVIVILSLLGCLFIVLSDSRFDSSAPKVVTTSESFVASQETNVSSTFPSSTPVLNTTIPPTVSVSTSHTSNISNLSSSKKDSPEKQMNSVRMFKKAIVTSSSDLCSEIGRNVFLKGGNVIDAVIATEVCVGGLEPHSAGLGGGNIILFHNGNSTIIINGQSRAPRSVTEDTFSTKPELSREGYASIAVPGELHSLWTAYKKFGSGRVSWKSLLWPTTELLEKGYPMSSRTERALQTVSKEFREARRAKSSRTEGEGDLLQNDELKDTLRRLAQSRDPVHLFYKGEMANLIVNEMKIKGGLVTKLDLVSYESSVEEPLVAKMTDDFLLLGAAPPSVFAAAQLAVRLALNVTPDVFDSVEFLNDIIQQARVAIEKIGDPQFSPEAKADALNMTMGEYVKLLETTRDDDSDGDQVPSKISTVIAADASGSVAILTSTLFANLGSQRSSDKLGFVWNNEMGAFNLKATEEDEVEDINGVQGSKRPRTALAPLILLNNTKWKTATSIPGDLQQLGPLIKHLVLLITPNGQEEKNWTTVKNSEEGLSATCESHQFTLCPGIRGY